MGKSSLRVQTMQRLKDANVACASIDITLIGNQQVTPEQWYGSLIRSLVNSFELAAQFNLRAWWTERESLSPLQCLDEFIEGVLLEKLSGKIAIFVDEIDSVLSLNFPTDDFFAFIRACYNKRADKPAYKRLTFALLGVATPSDLIQDKNRTPFNIGKAIPLSGFQLNEIETLAQGLVGKSSNPKRVLQEILTWTGGQPFLTQRICRLIRESPSSVPDGYEAGWIRDLVQTQVIDNWETQDEQAHLRTIRDRLMKSGQSNKKNGHPAARRLGLYQQILQQDEVAITDSSKYMDLLLTGLVIRHQTSTKHHSPVLKVYNRIAVVAYEAHQVLQ